MREPFSNTKHHRRPDQPDQHPYEVAGAPAGRHGGGPSRGRHDRHHHHGEGHHGHRVRRGEARYLLLDALRDGPMHGYEIIKSLEEKSTGQYAPSPGSVYPTLQLLEELGHVGAEQDAERRKYHLTQSGQVELDAHAEEVKTFWAQFKQPVVSKAGQAEVSFLQDEMEHLNKTVWGGLRTAIDQGDKDTVRRVRQAIERCQDEVRGIISGETV